MTRKRKKGGLAKSEIKNVVLYCRVSTVEQAEKDLSLPAQESAMRKYAESHGYNVLKVYTEPGASGRDDANRKVYMAMMADVIADDSEVDAILVYHSSRFFRNSMKARIAKKDLARRGVRVVSISQETSDDAMGEVIEKIFEVFDEYESEMNALRTLAAMRENARRGYINGSSAPYGFKAETIDVGGRPRRKLVPNVDEVAIHNEVVRLYVQSGGAKTVAMELQSRGVAYRNTPWTKQNVLKVIEEAAAIGVYYWGRVDTRTGELNDPSEWISIPCEPIIDKDLFEAAQKTREKRDPMRHPGRTASSPMLLAGLVECGKCGGGYTLESSGKTSSEGEYLWRYYNCNRFLRSGKDTCPGHRISEAVLDRVVTNHVASKIFTVDRCRQMLKDITEEAGVLRSKAHDQRREHERQLGEVDRKIARWTEAFESGTLDLTDGRERLRELREKREQLAETLRKVCPFGTPPMHLYKPEAVASFQNSLKEIFLSGNTGVTKRYLNFLIEKVLVTDEALQIEAKAEAAVKWMSFAASGAPLVNQEDAVLANDLDWLRLQDSNLRPGG